MRGAKRVTAVLVVEWQGRTCCRTPMELKSKLRVVKTIHTVVWAVFAGSIFAIPAYTHQRRLGISATLIAFVLIEVAVLALNKMRCPLTDVGARYTEDRRDNFDIYLPLWLAKHNKLVFGTLFIAGIVYTLVVWASGHAAN